MLLANGNDFMGQIGIQASWGKAKDLFLATSIRPRNVQQRRVRAQAHDEVDQSNHDEGHVMGASSEQAPSPGLSESSILILDVVIGKILVSTRGGSLYLLIKVKVTQHLARKLKS